MAPYRRLLQLSSLDMIKAGNSINVSAAVYDSLCLCRQAMLQSWEKAVSSVSSDGFGREVLAVCPLHCIGESV